MFFDNSIEKFMTYFNQIDKKLDDILNNDKFLPFNEKIKFIANEKFYISSYIKKHQKMLKNFGEIRNELNH